MFSFNMSMNPLFGNRRFAASSTPADHQTWPENPQKRWRFPASHVKDCRRVLARSLGIIYPLVEGSLEVKLPPIWTVEKQR